MSNLVFNTVFREISSMFRGETFSTMYFGRHFGKNVLILKHDLTLMIVFGNNDKLSSPEFIKSVSFRGEGKRGTKVVGHENIVLLLDECGHLWKLTNAFELIDNESASLHSLNEDCFYEWIRFKKFNLVKVLALSETKHGFACLGVTENLRKKLIMLKNSESVLIDLTFEELNSTTSSSYYLTNLNICDHQDMWISLPEEALLITDRFSGRTYLLQHSLEHRRTSVINASNHFLISALHFPQKKCLLLSFENGKLTFLFFNRCRKQCDLYLSKKIVFLEKCCCSDTCLLWSDGIILRHTKLTFCDDENFVKVVHLKVNCSIQTPVSLLKICQQALIVTINNFYYSVSPGLGGSEEIKKSPQEILVEISKGSSLVGKLEEKTDMLVQYLYWKDIIEKDKAKGKLQIDWEGDSKGNLLTLKNSLGVPLREEIWKLRLSTSDGCKTFVHHIDLDGHLSKGSCITFQNTFKTKCKLKLCLIGNFKEGNLYLDLGEVEQFETNFEKNQVIETLEKILWQRKNCYLKGT